MERRQKWLGVLLLCFMASSSVLSDDHEDFMRAMEQAVNASIAAGVDPNEILLEDDAMVNLGTNFQCPLPHSLQSRPAASSVHALSPADISVVAALGDSLTAGFGAKARTLLTALIEFRGVSWSIGGDSGLSSVTTLPNIIKKYNPNVKGFSIKTGTHTSGNSKFNVGVSGAKADGMLTQARRLVEKLDGDPEVDLENDWKLVTLFIGGNDLCAYCNDKDRYSHENFAKNIKDAILYLKDDVKLPKTLINLVHTVDVKVITQTQGLICPIVHFFVCRCAGSSGDEVSEAADRYRVAVDQMVNSGVFDDRDDFTVVVQPFPAGITDVPRKGNGKVDMSFFAPDCFHFSQKAHKDAAITLWNNMLQPVGQKTLGWEHDAPLNCPDEKFPYFYTNKNSQQAGSFGAAPPPDPAADSPADHSVNYLGILLGSGVAAYVVTMAVIVVVVGTVWYHRRRRRLVHFMPARVSCDTEKITLLKN